MTIFYVDPVNGSNSNNGTSWGTAWKWLPGNGTAVQPGDEVRFAKSNQYQTTLSATLTGASTFSIAPLGYSYHATASSWVLGSGGGTLTTRGVNFTGGTNVPSNTKLAYGAATTTITTGNGLFLEVRMRGVPTGAVGTYLRIAFCSDSAGNTPLFYLTGRTVLVESTAGLVCRILFEYNSATTLNFTVNSIAIYSIGAFTIAPDGGTITVDGAFVRTPLQTGPLYLKQGAVYIYNNPRLTEPAPAVERKDAYYFPPQVSYSGSDVNLLSPYYRNTNYTNSPSYHVLDIYDPLPTDIYELHTVGLTYNGTAGSPIRMTGGWNTATNTQDGYTNMSIGGIAWAPRHGAFTFSAGGQYIQYERFLCMQGSLVTYTYVVNAISQLYLTECVVGRGVATPSGHVDAGTVGFHPSVTSVTFSDLKLTGCTSLDLMHAVPGTSGAVLGLISAYNADKLSFGNVELIDSFIWSWGSYTTSSAVSGTFVVRSSVAGTLRSFLCPTSNVSLLTSLGLIDIRDTYIVTNSAIVDVFNLATPATTSLRLRDVVFSTFSGLGASYSCIVDFRNFKDVEIDGFFLGNPNYPYRAQSHVTVGWSATWLSANTPTIKWGGPFGTKAQYAYSATDYLGVYGWPGSLLDLTVSRPRALTLHTIPNSYWPNFRVVGGPGTLTVRGVEASSLIGTFETSLVASAYYPNHPEIRFEECVGKVMIDSAGPVGSVKALGGSAPGDAFHDLSIYGRTSVAPGAAYYGTQIDSMEDEYTYNAYNINSLNLSWARRAIGVDIKGSPTLSTGSETGAPAHVAAHFHMHPTATIDKSGLTPVLSNPYGARYGHIRGVSVRKPNGEFAYKNGASYVASSEALNEYGKHTITVFGGFQLARLDVKAGSLVTCNIRVRPTRATARDFCRIVVQPCTAYTTSLDGHAIQRTYVSTVADELVSFTLAPQKDGTVPINFFSSVVADIKDFTVSVA